MATITDIAVQKKNKQRASIFLDGRFYCGLERLTVIGEGLEIGDEIDPHDLALIQQKSESVTAFDKATRYISTRMRCECELRKYLAGKGYLQQVIDCVIDKLKEYRYIDDEAFCKAYIADHRRRKGMKMIEYELARLKIDREVIAFAVQDAEPQDDEALRLARKYLSTHDADARKVSAYLFGKGFDSDTAKSAARQAADEERERAEAENDESENDGI